MSVHRNLTGADLHEPKGADTALSGQVYVANGTGGGVWTDASTIITNTAFTTGDLKNTHKTAADAGWVMWSDGSIGDASSSATIRANADTSSLFTLYWNSYSNTLCPVSGGRGVSAAADFAAHKRLSVPVGAGRAFGLAGTGSGLTARTLGDGSIGSETRSLVTANLPAYTPTGTVSSVMNYPGTSGIVQVTGTNNVGVGGTATGGQLVTANITSTFTGVAQGGTSTSFSIVPPMTYINVMIKL